PRAPRAPPTIHRAPPARRRSFYGPQQSSDHGALVLNKWRPLCGFVAGGLPARRERAPVVSLRKQRLGFTPGYLAGQPVHQPAVTQIAFPRLEYVFLRTLNAPRQRIIRLADVPEAMVSHGKVKVSGRVAAV